MGQLTLAMFLVFAEISLVRRSVGPIIYSIAMFHVIFILSFISVPIVVVRSPNAFAISHSVFELPFIDGTVAPAI